MGKPSPEMLGQELKSLVNLTGGWAGMTAQERIDLTESLSGCCQDLTTSVGGKRMAEALRRARAETVERRPEPLAPEVKEFLDGVESLG